MHVDHYPVNNQQRTTPTDASSGSTPHINRKDPYSMDDVQTQVLQAEACLYVVATPIGNLEDITARALQVLASGAVVAAEDTRHVQRLLDRHGIRGRTQSLHAHNEQRAAPELLAMIAAGSSVALVSDAGTPAISDPGAVLVAMAHARGIRVVPLPGPSALITALSAAGMLRTEFSFLGFLPARASARRSQLQTLLHEPRTLIFYEAPHRITECVDDLVALFPGQRALVLARELTKTHESIHRCELAEAPAWLAQDDNHRRGEFVLVLEGAPAREQGDALVQQQAAEQATQVLTALLAELPVAQAVRLATAITGQRRNVLYPLALRLSQNSTET